MAEEVVLRFNDVTFEYIEKKPVIEDASFSLRKSSKYTLMGQNGAGKSTIFKLITEEITPKSGKVSIDSKATVGTAKQMVNRDDFDMSVEDYFARKFEPVPGSLKSKISKVLEAVNMDIPFEKKVGDLSGGQQARLLLAEALIVEPDILLLDEPTNNLDQEGIDHLLSFLIMYDKTVLVISHDADFLNCFTEGVVYLDIHSQQTEIYVGDYYSVVEEISQRIEREQRKNAQLQKQIKDRKEKANYFSHKGGKMRKLAQKMKEETSDLEDSIVDVKREDKEIRDFFIPVQEDLVGNIVEIRSVKVIKNHEPVEVEMEKDITKSMHVIIKGPNGIGKSTFLRSLVAGKSEEAHIKEGIRMGYYSQDFTNLDLDQKVYDSLQDAMFDREDDQELRSTAAGFLLTGNFMGSKIRELSEGQKGLLSFARLSLMKPGILILDEPTNHINFRHLPIIAKAINEFAGPVIMVSHMSEFISTLRIDDEIDLGK
ncbi:MAG: ATP-binding cassette domain-containing protein [Patescibacteria group bacterium]|jgi:ATP-binding cassette subfamily F protein 3|nr:ATP-binding cassette domain-containing protein [Patescibacteria group bacterium]